jgi:biopolymer transport protein ExbB/TolQ
MNSFSVKEIFLLGWPILSLLLACSVLSLAVILERWVFFQKRKIDLKDVLKKIPKILSRELDEASWGAGEPLLSLLRSALSSGESKSSLELSLDREVRMQVSEMEKFVPLLGTVAGAAPFIGLLGTVMGIIRAFKSIAVSGGGGPQVVAAGIAEALTATALGLFVAIPALVFYNYYSTKIRRLTESMEICADEIVEILSKK